MNEILLDIDKSIIITPSQVLDLIRNGETTVYVNGERIDLEVQE